MCEALCGVFESLPRKKNPRDTWDFLMGLEILFDANRLDIGVDGITFL